MAKTAKASGRKASAKKTSSGAKKPRATSSRKKSASKSSINNHDAASNKEELMKLFEHALRDMYWVEKSLTKAIPKMIKQASSEELQSVLEDHLMVTSRQVSGLDKVFSGIDMTARAKKCAGMEGILKEGEELMKEFAGPIQDAAIIAAAQKVEHYEISSYVSMITLARTLDLVKEAAILQGILDEEVEADRLLTNLSVKLQHLLAMGE